MAEDSLHPELGVSRLPDGWSVSPLEELLEPKGLAIGVMYPGAHDPEGVPIVRVKNMQNGGISQEDVLRVSEVVEAKHPGARLRGGEVLLSLVGSVGRVAIVPEWMSGWNTARAVAVMRLGQGVSNYWVKTWLTSDVAQHYIQSRLNTTVQATLNLRDVRNIPVVLPPTRDCLAIVGLLGALDDKIAVNERIRRTALSLAHTYFEAASMTSEPERIGDIADLFDGPHATPQKTEAGPWFLGISSLNNGYLDLTESAHLSEEDFPRWTRRVQPQAGDVLFSYETRLGNAALMPPGIRGSLGRRMALLRSKSASVSGALLLHAYLSSGFQEEIKRRTIHGATVDRLPLKEMPGWPIPLPTDIEREPLSAQLDLLHARGTQVAAENHALTLLRDTLLPQLMSGKLRVRDAEKIVEDAV